MMTWPPHLTFPVLDLLRLTFLQFEGAKIFAQPQSIEEIIKVNMSHRTKMFNYLQVGRHPNAHQANPTLLWRSLANLYAHTSIWQEKKAHPIEPAQVRQRNALNSSKKLMSVLVDDFDAASKNTKLAMSIVLIKWVAWLATTYTLQLYLSLLFGASRWSFRASGAILVGGKDVNVSTVTSSSKSKMSKMKPKLSGASWSHLER